MHQFLLVSKFRSILKTVKAANSRIYIKSFNKFNALESIGFSIWPYFLVPRSNFGHNVFVIRFQKQLRYCNREILKQDDFVTRYQSHTKYGTIHILDFTSLFLHFTKIIKMNICRFKIHPHPIIDPVKFKVNFALSLWFSPHFPPH